MTTDTKLWALLIPGPDELHPMPSREAADDAMTLHNAIVDAEDWPYPDLRDSCRAQVVEWPYDAQSHADMIDSGESGTLSGNALGIPDSVAEATGLTANALAEGRGAGLPAERPSPARS